MTCQHFAYGVDQHCHTLVGCNLRQQLQQQGEHLIKRCQQWTLTWQKAMGWDLEMERCIRTAFSIGKDGSSTQHTTVIFVSPSTVWRPWSVLLNIVILLVRNRSRQ